MTATIFKTPSALRHEWLEAATAELRPLFASKGHEVPENIRISIGWPKGGKGNTIGQCWYAEGSSDKHNEIFISPALRDTLQIAATLAHELVHAIAGKDAGHKAPFKRIALAIGLEGKMTETTAGAEFVAWSAPVFERIGQYPGGSIVASGRKKQSTRLVKCSCEGCDYVVRTTRKWIEDAGAPICPTDEVQMEVA
jgi:hypothetical protein